MTAKGHLLLASALAYTPIVYINSKYGAVHSIISYLIILTSALLPDIDEPKSYIGNKATGISQLLKLLGLKHRTLTHWLIFPMAIVLIGFLLGENNVTNILYLIAYGVLAHDIGDMLTKGGINGFLFPLFPNTKIALLPYSLRFYTFSLTEKIVNTFLLVINLYIYSNFLKDLLPIKEIIRGVI